MHEAGCLRLCCSSLLDLIAGWLAGGCRLLHVVVLGVVALFMMVKPINPV